ncbi:MAG: hypothetical protein M5U26_21965 [Planctomycetota bacterium]|nr:hypothetical protein [Planctomycetota bacterium]
MRIGRARGGPAWPALCLLLCGLAGAAESPYARAREGDWIEWKVVQEDRGQKHEYTHRDTLVERKDESVVVESTTDVSGQPVSRRSSFNLKESSASPRNSKAIQQEKQAEGEEILELEGKSYKCRWVQWKITVTLGEQKLETVQKVWTCPDVPMGGKVKSVVQNPGGTQTFVLAGFGKAKP